MTTGTPYPIRVHCAVWEHDGGIGAEREDVLQKTRTINNPGSFTIEGSNDEGDVALHFTVDTDSGNGQTCDGLEPGPPAPWTPTYDALFVAGTGSQTGQYLYDGLTSDAFADLVNDEYARGYYPVAAETHVVSGVRVWGGVFRPGTGDAAVELGHSTSSIVPRI